VVGGLASVRKIWAVDVKNPSTGSAENTYKAPAQAPDTTSRMAAPAASAVAGIQSFGGAPAITAGASTATTVISYDLMGTALAKAISAMPAPQLSLVELADAQRRVDFLDDVTVFRS
jgi:hypothetical protein